jgi:hypothetical protein
MAAALDGGGAAGRALAGELRQLLLRTGSAQRQQQDQSQPGREAQRAVARRCRSVTAAPALWI